MPMTLRPLLTRDPQRMADSSLRQGDRLQALKALVRAKEWRRAAQLAAELGEEEKVVEYSLLAAFGTLPEGRRLDARGAADLLAREGRHNEAILLFETTKDYLRAGESALALRQPVRAARYFQQGEAWQQAAACYEEAGKLREALETVEEGVRSLNKKKGLRQVNASRMEELNVKRADLLLQMGRGDAAATLLRSLPPSLRGAELLERGERYENAFQHYLEMGRIDEATRVAAKIPNRDRLTAQIYLRTGRPAEAGDLLARLGLAREAAEAYEAAQDWSRAAYRWEAAQEPRRAAESYRKAGRLQDAARCFEAANMPSEAAEVQRLTAAPPPAATIPSRASIPVRRSQSVEAARTCLSEGDKNRAASILMQMNPDDSGFAEGALLLAPLLVEEGFFEETMERLRHIPEVDSSGLTPPFTAERDYWLSRSLEGLGQVGAARACYERLEARHPGHRDARARAERLQQGASPWTTGRLDRPEPVVHPAGFLKVGSRLAGRYEILDELGRGGMARVCKARDLDLGEPVAVKMLLMPGEEGFGNDSRLLREVQICRKISHPNVVRVYDLGRFDGGLFVTMEYLEGCRLDELLAQEGPLPFARIRSILTEIAAGLAEAHTQGIVHRDLKPSNIMVTPGRVKILDFGIASMRGLGARLTQPGIIVGSPMFMSPEQILGRELDGRSDLYSLGILAYTLIAGREPWETGDLNVLVVQQLRETPPDVRSFRRETPKSWVAFLGRLLAKEPEDRFQSAQEVFDELAKDSL